MTNRVNASAATSTHRTHAAPAGERMLGSGDSGADVKALQEQLSKLGFDVKTDSTFGPKTKAAVIAFQTAYGVTPADGKVGPKTRAALAAATPKSVDGAAVSGAAGAAAAAAGTKAADAIMTYGNDGKSRLDEQKEAAQQMLSQLVTNAKVAGITAIPIFTPAALAICLKYSAQAIDKIENGKPQPDPAKVWAEANAAATKEILNLPNTYAQAGMAGLEAIQNGAFAVAGAVADGASWAAQQASDFATGTFNAASDAVNAAYNTAVDYGSAAVTTAEDVGSKAWEGTKKAAHVWWHFETTPIRVLGRGLSAIGNFFKGIGN